MNFVKSVIFSNHINVKAFYENILENSAIGYRLEAVISRKTYKNSEIHSYSLKKSLFKEYLN